MKPSKNQIRKREKNRKRERDEKYKNQNAQNYVSYTENKQYTCICKRLTPCRCSDCNIYGNVYEDFIPGEWGYSNDICGICDGYPDYMSLGK